MSQPQASLYSESFIDPDILQSDDLPTFLSSQSTVTTSAFTPPAYLSYAPRSLQRVGPTLRKFWILYSSEPEMEHSRKQFVEWWLTTGFGLDPQCRDGLHWDGKKKSDLWENFEQVAHEKTGEPKVMCKHCFSTLAHPGHKRAGTSALKTHLKGGACRLDKKRRGTPIDQLMRDIVSLKYHIVERVITNINLIQPTTLTKKGFSQDLLQQRILNFITTARLPFRIVEHREFKDLVEVIQLAQTKIDIPSARTMRRLLDTTVQEKQRGVLSKLPIGSHLSIALDCWTSPFSQAFMAITGYFLDQDWNYCEVLLGFEHLHGSHSGSHLSETVIQILKEHDIANRVLSITTDNASNNNTMMIGVQEILKSQALSDASIFRVPCIAHVIQLCLKGLLGKMKAKPRNKGVESRWSDARTQSLQSDSRQPTRNIVHTLKKVSIYLPPLR
jgi:hypothetical protein